MDADLVQWNGCSKMSSLQMEALIRLHGDAVEIQVRGPPEIATSCFYFLEDVTNLVEQTAQEVAPGISLERHFLSPKHLKVKIILMFGILLGYYPDNSKTGFWRSSTRYAQDALM